MKQIVCLATSPWYPIPTRKQQVMSRIPDAEILYFDPSVSVIAPLKDKKARPMLTAYKKEGFRPQKNITVYSLPPVLPFFNKSRAINRVNQKRIAAYVRKIMKRHGFEKPLLWVYSPVTVDAVEHIPHSALVYDCVDRHSAYGGLMDPALVDAEERMVLRFSVTSSPTRPSPRVAPRTNRPFTYSSATDRPSTFGSTL